MVPFDKAIVLRKYEISYFECSTCGFVQTEEPYWLEEAYSDSISHSDIGLLSRNLINLEFATTAIALFFSRKGKFLDYGGGYGLFVRLMRDKGFDFYLYEPNCENLFAKTFDVKLPTNKKFDMLTAFEVFEHLKDPLEEVEQMLKLSPNIFFSTTLLPKPSPKPAHWWYYSLEGGQHISLYTRASLKYLAERLGINVYSDGRSYHLLTNKKISSSIYTLAMRIRISRVFNWFVRQPSLLSQDYLKVVGRPLE
jgi:hypothetical protein